MRFRRRCSVAICRIAEVSAPPLGPGPAAAAAAAAAAEAAAAVAEPPAVSATVCLLLLLGGSAASLTMPLSCAASAVS